MDVESRLLGRVGMTGMGGRHNIEGWTKNDQIHTNKHETTEEHI